MRMTHNVISAKIYGNRDEYARPSTIRVKRNFSNAIKSPIIVQCRKHFDRKHVLHRLGATTLPKSQIKMLQTRY